MVIELNIQFQAATLTTKRPLIEISSGLLESSLSQVAVLKFTEIMYTHKIDNVHVRVYGVLHYTV